LELSQAKRDERGAINPYYGYFAYNKEKGRTEFQEGVFLKEIRDQLQHKNQQIL
jgi:hypothetical protein